MIIKRLCWWAWIIHTVLHSRKFVCVFIITNCYFMLNLWQPHCNAKHGFIGSGLWRFQEQSNLPSVVLSVHEASVQCGHHCNGDKFVCNAMSSWEIITNPAHNSPHAGTQLLHIWKHYTCFISEIGYLLSWPRYFMPSLIFLWSVLEYVSDALLLPTFSLSHMFPQGKDIPGSFQ